MRNSLIALLGLFLGLNSNALIGGKPVLPNDVLTKAVVGVYIEHTGVKGGKYCTGTLIAPQIILTSAHCLVNENNLNIYIGFQTEPMKVIDQDDKELVRTSHKGLIYPGYLKAQDEWERKRNDVALVYLDSKAPDWAVPMPIVPPYSLPVFTDKVLVAASGSEKEGSTEQHTPLKKAEFYILKDVETYMAVMHIVAQPEDSILPLLKNATNTSNVLFLTQVQPEAQTTHGDSGSPAIINKYGIPSVLGVLSGALQLENFEFGTFFVNLHESNINRWIRSN